MNRRSCWVVLDRIKHVVQHEPLLIKCFQSQGEECWCSQISWSQAPRQKISQSQPKNQTHNLVLLESSHPKIHKSIFERLPLCTATNKQTRKAPPQLNYCHLTLCYWVHYSHICSRLQESSVPLLPLQDRTGCTCSVFSKPRVGAKTRTTHTHIHTHSRKRSTLSGDAHKWFQSWVPLKGLSPLENRGRQH